MLVPRLFIKQREESLGDLMERKDFTHRQEGVKLEEEAG